jgi:hypothetical protein
MAFRSSIWNEIRRAATSSRRDRVDMRNLLFGALFPAPNHQCLVQMASFFGKSGAPDLDQTVSVCLGNSVERARQQYLHRGKILRQSESAKTQLFFWQCLRSGQFALIHGIPLVCLARNSTGSYVQSTRSCGYAELIIWSSFPGPRPPMFG